MAALVKVGKLHSIFNDLTTILQSLLCSRIVDGNNSCHGFCDAFCLGSFPSASTGIRNDPTTLRIIHAI